MRFTYSLLAGKLVNIYVEGAQTRPDGSRRFIPWPDTQRLWRAHLPLDRITFLDRFLPPEEVAA